MLRREFQLEGFGMSGNIAWHGDVHRPQDGQLIGAKKQ